MAVPLPPPGFSLAAQQEPQQAPQEVGFPGVVVNQLPDLLGVRQVVPRFCR
jgi:hypothetical protein